MSGTFTPAWLLAVCAAAAGAWTASAARASAAGQPSHGKPCVYGENCSCPAPGITLRWKAAYCMAMEKTDDFENEAVQQCLATPDPAAVRGQPPCSQNAYWKAEMCRVSRASKKEADACARDRKVIPDIVAKGAGG